MIQSISLGNFKCFENNNFEFAPLTFLSGLNGTGKSSVLQSLLLLRQSFNEGHLEKVGLSLNGELVHIGTAKDALYEDAQEERISFEIKWVNGNQAQWTFDYVKEADVLGITSPKVPNSIFNESLFNNHFQYLQAERIGPRTSFPISDNIVKQNRQLGTKGQYTAHYLSIFESAPIALEKLSHPNAKSLQLRHQVEAWLNEISPGTRIHIDLHPGIDVVSIGYSFEGENSVTGTFRSTNVGFGLTYTLPVIVAILSSTTESLLLIENPEAHLHPKGQVQMGRLIALAASLGVQIVVETHSDHVLNGIRLSVHSGDLQPNQVKFYFFDRLFKETGVSNIILSPTIDTNGRINKWPEHFFDEIDKSLETLLQPAKNNYGS